MDAANGSGAQALDHGTLMQAYRAAPYLYCTQYNFMKYSWSFAYWTDRDTA